MRDANLKRLVTAALLASMTCIATMIIKFPTPTLGYIHLGDGFVLLCGIILGPLPGAIAAGIGSMFSDIFLGYAAFAPATLVIKGITAGIAGFIFQKSACKKKSLNSRYVFVIAGGIVGETLMVLGYFLYETGIAAFGTGTLNQAAITAGIVSSAAGIPFNTVQGIAGILICTLLLPVLLKVPDIRDSLSYHSFPDQ